MSTAVIKLEPAGFGAYEIDLDFSKGLRPPLDRAAREVARHVEVGLAREREAVERG